VYSAILRTRWYALLSTVALEMSKIYLWKAPELYGKTRHKEVAVAAMKEEHPDADERVRPIPSLVPDGEGVEELAHMEAVNEGPAVLTVSLKDELNRALEATPVPGRCPWNEPISAVTPPATTMRTVRRMRSNFGTDLSPCLGAGPVGLRASNFPDGV
jgi:hypothetical protein